MRALVVVAAYNQLPHLRRALRGYLRQTTNDFALIVADDGSRDGSLEYLDEIASAFATKGIPFQYVTQGDEGFRKTRILNEAIRQAPKDAPLIIFSDGDCVPPAHFVERHVGVHEPLSLHVAGAVRLSQEQSEALTEYDIDSGAYEHLDDPESRRKMRKKARQSKWGTRVRRRNRPKILGLNMAIDRALFEALNGFDERFQSWGIGEDTDLRDRAMRHRPRPRVKVLYTLNDVFHLWHPVTKGRRSEGKPYYETKRPVRCEMGLVQ